MDGHLPKWNEYHIEWYTSRNFKRNESEGASRCGCCSCRYLRLKKKTDNEHVWSCMIHVCMFNIYTCLYHVDSNTFIYVKGWSTKPSKRRCFLTCLSEDTAPSEPAKPPHPRHKGKNYANGSLWQWGLQRGPLFLRHCHLRGRREVRIGDFLTVSKAVVTTLVTLVIREDFDMLFYENWDATGFPQGL